MLDEDVFLSVHGPRERKAYSTCRSFIVKKQ
jgi:hypothetical protein